LADTVDLPTPPLPRGDGDDVAHAGDLVRPGGRRLGGRLSRVHGGEQRVDLDLDGLGAVEPGERGFDGLPDLGGDRRLRRVHRQHDLHRAALDLDAAHRAGLDQAVRRAGGPDLVQLLEHLLLGERHSRSSFNAASRRRPTSVTESFSPGIRRDGGFREKKIRGSRGGMGQ
jgi:hypothetical protein